MNKKKKSLSNISLKTFFSFETFLVVDIGSRGMKVIEAKRKGYKYTIERAFYISGMDKFYKGQMLTDVSGVVDTLLHKLQVEEIKTKNILLNFTNARLQSKVIRLPNVTEKELKNLIEIEYQKQFPNNSRISDVMDYMPVGRYKKDDVEYQILLLAVIPISEVSSIIKEFESRKLTVKDIDIQLHAMTNIGKMHESENSDKVVIDIGYESTTLNFMRNESTIFSRNISYGLSNLFKSIQNETSLTRAEIQNVVEEYGLNPKEDIMYNNRFQLSKEDYKELVNESFGSVVNEIFRSFQYVNVDLGLEIEDVIFTGGISVIEGAKEIAESILDVNIIPWKLNKNELLELDNGVLLENKTKLDINGLFANCIGMALRGLY